MNNFKNELFLKYALVVFVIIAFFEGILIFALKKSFDTHLKDKLALIATQIDPKEMLQNKKELLKLQQKYKVFPLYVQIAKIDDLNSTLYKNINEGYKIQNIKTFLKHEKVITYTLKKEHYIINVSTLYSTNNEKISIIKIISILVAFFIYLISLLVGYKFIETISNQIEISFKKLKNFNSNVSHELKTPLTIIKGEIELALMNKDKDCEKVLKNILEEVNYISEITDKLLFLTKTHSKKSLSLIDLEEIILELHEKYGNKIEFQFNFGEEDYEIAGDKTLIKIALSNIIENSIKYGAKKIIFTLQKHKNKIILKIKDNGPGIPKEKLPFIFDEFYRVDESHSKNIKGFGLGLSIVRNILNLHNAKVKVKSEGGVEFIIEFPALSLKNQHSS
ncbi:HAMP domain-containing histidine kinase [Caminibacter mediatlanticus TB-2]|uniref:histidine kinase n=1 Tax=Caminibacter mediatlanticus TB-2 TaxID=391592 RepID=A0ABX5VAH3_9BACT|nr:HAMP domain-containing sensor histidine kinase [Caminibacter mediatlanticus]QCT95300.1 HAMP domain-containing histidine kinase [Caminibacter mediatlanticus TB-2]